MPGILRPNEDRPQELGGFATETRPGGLVVARGRAQQPTNERLQGLVQQARREILRPEPNTIATQANTEQIERFGSAKRKEEVIFAGSELALLAKDPEQFVQRMVTKWVPGFERRPFGAQVLESIRNLPEDQLSVYTQLTD